MILNKRITEAIELLKCFNPNHQNYYLKRLKGLCDSEKGFIYLYLGLAKVK